RVYPTIGLAQAKRQAQMNRAVDLAQYAVDGLFEGTGVRHLALLATSMTNAAWTAQAEAWLHAHAGNEKTARWAVFSGKRRVLQTGHLLDRFAQLVVRAIGTGAFRRHGVDTGDGFGQDAVEAALVVGALFPGSGVTDFRSTQYAGAMAGVAVLGDDVVSGAGTTGGSGDGFDALALFAHDAHFADRLEALGDGFIGRGLSSHCPQGQYGSRYCQHFLHQIHGTPSSWLVTPAATVSRAGDSITASAAHRNNPYCRRVIGAAALQDSILSASSSCCTLTYVPKT